MCGIIAAVSKHGRISDETLALATRRLRHRGPDAQHVWYVPDGRAGLGHARLSIIDLETGDQPIANEDEQLRIVVNGELYDFERIRRRSSATVMSFARDRTARSPFTSRRTRRARAAFAARRVRLRDLGRARRPALRRARPLRHQAALLRRSTTGPSILASEVKAFAELGVPLALGSRDAATTSTSSRIHRIARCSPASTRSRPASCLFTDGEQVRVLPYWDWDYPTDAMHGARKTSASGLRRLACAFEDAVRLDCARTCRSRVT